MTEERKKQYDQTYMKMAQCMGNLSYANRSKVGCIILSRDGQVISQGFNGTPSGMNNDCETVECTCQWNHGCARVAKPIDEVKNINFCKGCEHCKLVTKPEVLHAESNAIAKCAKWLNTTEGATLYVTLSPCAECAKLIMQSGIKRVCYHEKYRDIKGISFLKNNGIIVDEI